MKVWEMTKEDFDKVPELDGSKYENGPIEFTQLVVIPSGELHDSGYMIMDFCLVKDGDPIGMVHGGCDVVDLDGSGGVAFRCILERGFDPTKQPPWRLDCLPCGYISLWAQCGTLRIRSAWSLSASTLEILADPRKKE